MTRLTPQHWIEAGLSALAEGGAQAVRIDRISKQIGVTRGSFYWHFADRQAFMESLLASWREQRTDGVIQEADAIRTSPGARLRALLRLCFRDDGRLEVAIRAWSRADAQVMAVVRAVDARRIAYLSELLEALGHDRAAALSRARIGYRAWLGGYLLADRSPASTHDGEADELFALLTRERDEAP